MFQRFTERARYVVVMAQDEARALEHNYIGTEHLLLGLLREEESVAPRVLESLGVALQDVRAEVVRIVGRGNEVTPGQVPFTPRAKKALELATQEALSLGDAHIGTEHILLGVAREDEGVASRILLDFGVDADRIRDRVIRFLGREGNAAIPPRVEHAPASAGRGTLPRRTALLGRRRGADDRPPAWPAEALLLGWSLFGAAAALGLLVGWLIWG